MVQLSGLPTQPCANFVFSLIFPVFSFLYLVCVSAACCADCSYRVYTVLFALKNFVADCGAPSNESTHQRVTGDSHQFPASAVWMGILYYVVRVHMLDAYVADT